MPIVILLLIITYLIFAVNYKKNYYISEGLCIDYSTGRAFTSYPIYEYEIERNGIKSVKRSRGIAFGYPRKGKKYKILIHKKKENKVVSYSEYVSSLAIVIILIVLGVGLTVLELI